MGRPAPKPENFNALADAWDNPEEFAHELNRYYAQLARERADGVPAHWTEARHGDAS